MQLRITTYIVPLEYPHPCGRKRGRAETRAFGGVGRCRGCKTNRLCSAGSPLDKAPDCSTYIGKSSIIVPKDQGNAEKPFESGLSHKASTQEDQGEDHLDSSVPRKDSTIPVII